MENPLSSTPLHSPSFLSQLEQEIEKLDLPNRKSGTSKDVLASKLKNLSIKVPILRKYAFSLFIQKKEEELLEALTHVWKNSQISDVMSWSLIQSEKFSSRFLHQHQNIFISWLDRVENWWHSDGLSSIYAKILEEELIADPERKFAFLFFQKLREWNTSSNPWKRRQSVVSLLYYSQQRITHLPYEQLISFVTPLLKDSEYYVQKGVGWTIREIYNIYPDKVKAFLKEHVREISPHAWLAATEKLDTKFKNKLLKMRKKKR
jgi:3-methyladenine DNA glycosylase AlkD